jgi:hypothetical protein
MGRKQHPKFKNMTKQQIEDWEEKMKYMIGDNKNKDATNQINQGKGWMF